MRYKKMVIEMITKALREDNQFKYEVGDIVGNTVQGFDFKVLKKVGDQVTVKNTKTGEKITGYYRNFYKSKWN